MFRVTRFCVQTFQRRPGGVAPAEAIEFKFEVDARETYRQAQRRSAGVALYAVTGEPVFSLWRTPLLLERHGDILPID